MNSGDFNSINKKYPPFLTSCWNDSEEMIEALVDVLESNLKNRLLEQNPKPIGLATGRTMIPIYRSLVFRLKSWPINDLKRLLKNWCSFNLDEYVGLSAGNSSSFTRYMLYYLATPLGLDHTMIHIPNGQAKNLSDEASLYSEQLKTLGGLSFQLLGLGNNGHLGFNEPPSGPDDSCRVVSLSSSTRLQNASFFSNDINQVPDMAITLGLREILEAEEIHLVVTGSHKASILKSLLNSHCSEDLPASWLKLHSNVFLWADYASLTYTI